MVSDQVVLDIPHKDSLMFHGKFTYLLILDVMQVLIQQSDNTAFLNHSKSTVQQLQYTVELQDKHDSHYSTGLYIVRTCHPWSLGSNMWAETPSSLSLSSKSLLLVIFRFVGFFLFSSCLCHRHVHISSTCINLQVIVPKNLSILYNERNQNKHAIACSVSAFQLPYFERVRVVQTMV